MSIDDVEWRSIPGYPGYMASNIGQILRDELAFPTGLRILPRGDLKDWVRKNVGVYVECDNCGRTVSKLNLTKHKRTARCRGAAL